MTFAINALIAWNVILTIAVAFVIERNDRLKTKVDGLKTRINAMIKGRESFYASLTDADAIMADMERGAVAMEALGAKRRRNIREDAGPHARIYKPKKIGNTPFSRRKL